MNTNQIPPGILAFKSSTGIYEWGDYRFKRKDCTYEEWVEMWLKTPGAFIHTISVDGKQWSVGDETNLGYGKITAFTYENGWFEGQGNWIAWFGKISADISLLTTPTVKDSGGEEKEFGTETIEEAMRILIDHAKECESKYGISGDAVIEMAEIVLARHIQPTPINPSEPEEKSKEEIVQNVFKDAHLGADRSSIKYFLETGTVNGGFMQLINECIMKYTKKQTDEFLAWREALSQCKAEGIDYERGWKAATKAVKLQAAKIQSLQAYNGKLVELLTCIRGAVATVEWNGADPKTTLGRIDNYADKALSSFTDKEIKP